MLRSMSKKLEIQMLYGQMGYGTVATGGVSGSVLTITTAEWAPGIWAGAEGMPIEIRDAAGTTSRGEFVVSSVSMDNRTLTLTTSAAAAGVVATDVIYHKGFYGNEFPGIHKILTTSSGSLFNISVSTYALWKGNEYSASSAALSFTKLSKAVARAVEKGLDGKVTCLVNPRTWADLLNDQAALRMYDQSYSSAQIEQGAKSIKFFSQNGEIEIVPSIYVKEGYSYLLFLDDWMRIGSSDITFKRPGYGTDFFRDVENSAAYELRLYTDQAIFCHSIGKNVIIKDIVNVA